MFVRCPVVCYLVIGVSFPSVNVAVKVLKIASCSTFTDVVAEMVLTVSCKLH